jgi:hypothetical protein
LLGVRAASMSNQPAPRSDKAWKKEHLAPPLITKKYGPGVNRCQSKSRYYLSRVEPRIAHLPYRHLPSPQISDWQWGTFCTVSGPATRLASDLIAKTVHQWGRVPLGACTRPGRYVAVKAARR